MIILQDYRTLTVLGIKNASYDEIKKIKPNIFFSLIDSLSKDQFIVKEILIDQSKKNALIKVKVNKHSKLFSKISQFNEINYNPYSYLFKLENQINYTIKQKKLQNNIIFKNNPKIIKKFGEEAIELIIESSNKLKKHNKNFFYNEAADVLYYYLLLLHTKGCNLNNILKKLKKQKRNI